MGCSVSSILVGVLCDTRTRDQLVAILVYQPERRRRRSWNAYLHRRNNFLLLDSWVPGIGYQEVDSESRLAQLGFSRIPK